METTDKIFDLIVIGGGPAGYSAAMTAAKLGLATLIIDSRDVLGGTCLNRGCIPTKALLHSSGLIRQLNSASGFGVEASASINSEKLFEYRDETVKILTTGLEQSVSASGAETVKGKAATVEVLADGTVEVKAGDSVYKAKDVLIATGTEPAMPPIDGIDSDVVITSNDILEGNELPESLIIVGGGVIGCEFASFYTDLGRKVTVIEALPRILANMDKDVARNLQMILKNRGAEIFSGAVVSRISDNGGKAEVNFSAGGEEKTVSADKVLIATGRRSVIPEGLAGKLETQKGRIVTDANGRTSVEHIYAAGDITNGIQLAHKAAAEGENIAVILAGGSPKHDMTCIPACVYCSPEIACAGMTDAEAKEKGIDAVTSRAVTAANSRSVISREERGFVKLVAEKETGILTGAQLMCANASDIIGELVLAITNRLTVGQCLKSVRSHPSYEETVGTALEELSKKI
ncbi:MAG: dihydrolipoyl dehydrogenase [Ruminococcaceae bacterium]|nr:dihydrolipoyl dehydrogenase [Oscillospiraceae bacterium]